MLDTLIGGMEGGDSSDMVCVRNSFPPSLFRRPVQMGSLRRPAPLRRPGIKKFAPKAAPKRKTAPAKVVKSGLAKRLAQAERTIASQTKKDAASKRAQTRALKRAKSMPSRPKSAPRSKLKSALLKSRLKSVT